MINKIGHFWINLIYAAFSKSYKNRLTDLAARAALLTNLGIGLILSGFIMKLGLRIFGLNNVWFLVFVALICFPLLYFLSENKIGLKENQVSKVFEANQNSSFSINPKLALILVLTYKPVCFVLMIVAMKYS